MDSEHLEQRYPDLSGVRTIEDLDLRFEGIPHNRDYFELQARLGTRAEGAAALDENGKFHCIHWFDCRYCPAFTSAHCL